MAASYTRSQSLTNAQLRPKKTRTNPTYSTSAIEGLLVAVFTFTTREAIPPPFADQIKNP